MSQDFPHEELSRALNRYETSVVAYRQRVDASGKPDELDQFHTSAVTPAREEFERLADGCLFEEKHRRLVEQLSQCHDESIAASYDLRHPSKSRVAEEYQKLAEKATALEAHCHKVRLALRKYRKDFSA
jgi:hypothetical protein